MPWALESPIGRKSQKVDVSAAGDNIIVSAIPGHRIKVLSWILQSTDLGVVQQVKWKDGAAIDLTGAFHLGGREAIVTSDTFQFQTTLGNALVLNLANASQIVGYVSYTDDDVA